MACAMMIVVLPSAELENANDASRPAVTQIITVLTALLRIFITSPSLIRVSVNNMTVVLILDISVIFPPVKHFYHSFDECCKDF